MSEAEWYLIRGEDYYLNRRELEDLIEGRNTVEYDADGGDFSLEKLRDRLRSEDLFQPVEAILVENIAYWKPSEEEVEDLMDLLRKHTGDKRVIFLQHYEGRGRTVSGFGRTRLYRRLKKDPGELINTDDELNSRGFAKKFTKQRANELGVELQGGALGRLTELTGESPMLIDSELRKLKMMVGERPVGRELVDEAVFHSAESAFWKLAEKLMSKSRDALSYLDRLLTEGHSAFGLLAHVSKQFRLLYWLTTGQNNHPDVESEPNWRLKHVRKHTNKWRAEQVREVLLKISRTEFDLKSGRAVARDSETAQHQALIRGLAELTVIG